MKRFAAVAALAVSLALPLAARAGLIGILVRSETTTSVTGQLIYICYYNVNGSIQRVVLRSYCPPTMEFD